MAANERSQGSCLGLLQQQGQEFDFFQAIRLLEKVTAPGQKIKFKAVNSEAFHSNFIAAIENNTTNKKKTNDDCTNNSLTNNGRTDNGDTNSHLEKNNITVSVNGFGLTGQQGPLPQCFSEMFRRATVSGKKGAEDPHAFLDIFNDKQVALLYDIKKIFDPMLFNEVPSENSLYKLLSSVSGFNTLNLFERLPIAKDKLATFTPVIANRRVDYSLIYNVLKSYLNCDVKITPNCGAWRSLPKQYQAQLTLSSKQKNKQESSLSSLHEGPGEDIGLGKGIGLGKKYWDNQAAISVDINVPNIEMCQNLLPGGSEYQQLKSLLSFLTDAKYFIYVKLLIEWKDILLSKLYKNTKLKLGQTSWLKSYQTLTARMNHPQFMIEPSIEYSFYSKQAEAAA